MSRYPQRPNHQRSRGRRPRHQNSGGLKAPHERIAHYVDQNSRDSTAKKEVEYFLNTAPEVAVEYFPALFTEHPELAERIPWVSLRGSSVPSSPVRLLRSQHLFGENYSFMKREALDFHTIPDNKARKLEFIVGDSLMRKRKKLVTFGYIGSSHCLATVKAAAQLSLKSEVVLLRCPLTADAVEMVQVMRSLGAKVRLRSTMRGVLWTAGWKWLCSKIFRTELIAPGGSDGFGVLGYISAMMELKVQIEDGLMVEPDYLFVAAGSGSTLVGMEIGKRMLGFSKTKIIGIQTSDDRGVDIPRLVEMGNAAIELLNQHLAKKISFKIDGSEFTILKDHIDGGHGQLSPELQRWMATFLELEPVELDSVYTVKALKGMSDYLLKNKIEGKSVLFWNTYSPYRKGDLLPKLAKKFSSRLKSWIRQDQREGRLAELVQL
ncbi:MAG: 1-aminocyclopropane-carboxylate deaminase [Bacteriovoracaceae bacterium]|nr:1-aminocyclopropane-carboxylate deaminase [Bacteriovoracaceae bacterium]